MAKSTREIQVCLTRAFQLRVAADSATTAAACSDFLLMAEMWERLARTVRIGAVGPHENVLN